MTITFLLSCKEFCLSSVKPMPDLKKQKRKFKVRQKLKGATTIENEKLLYKA